MDRLVNRFGLIFYIIFNITYGYIFIFNYALTSDYPFTKLEFGNSYSFFLKLSLIVGLVLSFHLLFLFKHGGRFFAVLSLVLAIFVHVFQLVIGYYFILAIFFIVIDLFIIYILSTPFVEGYLLSNPDNFIELISPKKREAYTKDVEVYLNIFTYLLTALGILNIILVIFYKVIFVSSSIMVLGVLSLFLVFAFFSISLFLHNREVKVIPYALYFFILLLFLTFYRYFLLPEPYSKFYNLGSFISTGSFGVLVFAIFDLLFAILSFIAGFWGLVIFLVNKRIINLFKYVKVNTK
jgi:hypothetical protein